MGHKGERTRTMVVERAARLFNRRGYHGASISEVLRETGLEKGGLYNHFGSKDALAVEAFEYSVGLLEQRFERALEGKRGAVDRLLAIVATFAADASDPLLDGGCPIFNTALEADDTHPELAARAREAMSRWQRLIGSIIRDGRRTGELRSSANSRAVASVLTATLEGALGISRLYGDEAHMRHAVDHLNAYVRGLASGRV